jgi:hypothetical protein
MKGGKKPPGPQTKLIEARIFFFSFLVRFLSSFEFSFSLSFYFVFFM